MPSGVVLFADLSSAAEIIKNGLSPIFYAIEVISAIVCVLFIVIGGYTYITSSGSPDKLLRAKIIIRNSAIGFTMVIGAGCLVTVMHSSYTQKPSQSVIVEMQPIKNPEMTGFGSAVNEAIVNFIGSVVRSLGEPILSLIKQYVAKTPSVGDNEAIFNVWLIIVAITDALFLLVIMLLGLRLMSASVLGLDEVDVRSLIPQIIAVFILSNTSIYFIDMVITVSNSMISALFLGVKSDTIWGFMESVLITAGSSNIGTLLFFAVVLILAVTLLVYYLQRIITLFVGAALSPLVILLWLVPLFRGFSIEAIKTYLITVFILFVHMTVLTLAASLFVSMSKDGNQLFAAIFSIATLLSLLKTGQSMNQMASANGSINSMKKLGGTFVRSISFLDSSSRRLAMNSVHAARPNPPMRVPKMSVAREHVIPYRQRSIVSNNSKKENNASVKNASMSNSNSSSSIKESSPVRRSSKSRQLSLLGNDDISNKENKDSKRISSNNDRSTVNKSIRKVRVKKK